MFGCLLLGACADDTVTGVSNSDSASGGTSGTTDIAPGTITADETGVGTVAGTGTGSDTGPDPDSTGTTTDTDTDTDTGEPADPGHGGGAFVNSGSHVGTSPGFRLLFTFGQSTQNQNTMTSPGYRLRGGFVPATQ